MEGVTTLASIIGVAVPLITLAGSAVAYVIKQYLDRASKRRSEFFELMLFIDDKDKPIATKMAAVYALRKYPEHKDFVVRFLESQKTNIAGSAAHLLIAEMDQTLEFMKK